MPTWSNYCGSAKLITHCAFVGSFRPEIGQNTERLDSCDTSLHLFVDTTRHKASRDNLATWIVTFPYSPGGATRRRQIRRLSSGTKNHLPRARPFSVFTAMLRKTMHRIMMNNKRTHVLLYTQWQENAAVKGFQRMFASAREDISVLGLSTHNTS